MLPYLHVLGLYRPYLLSCYIHRQGLPISASRYSFYRLFRQNSHILQFVLLGRLSCRVQQSRHLTWTVFRQVSKPQTSLLHRIGPHLLQYALSCLYSFGSLRVLSNLVEQNLLLLSRFVLARCGYLLKD